MHNLSPIRLDPMLEEFLSERRKQEGALDVGPPDIDGACFVHVRAKLSSMLKVDDAADVLSVRGVKISGDMLRAISEPTAPGMWFRVVRVEGGVAHIETRIENWNG